MGNDSFQDQGRNQLEIVGIDSDLCNKPERKWLIFGAFDTQLDQRQGALEEAYRISFPTLYINLEGEAIPETW